MVKSAGFDTSVWQGTARVFDGERAAMDALEDGTIVAGDVVVIRYEGPKGGPGMREMLAITGAIKVPASARTSWSPTAASPVGPPACVGHIAPEATEGGPIALVQDGDRIILDVAGGRLTSTSAPSAGEEAGRLGTDPPARAPRRTGQVRASGPLRERGRRLP